MLPTAEGADLVYLSRRDAAAILDVSCLGIE